MYNNGMIYKAKDLTRNERRKSKTTIRGVYYDEQDDLFDAYLIRYPTGIITLATALAYYGLIDEWVKEPYYFVFSKGYRPIKDARIIEFRDEKDYLSFGVVKKKKNGIEFLIFDKERLLIELWRKEKYLPKDLYKQAIFAYRNLASSDNFNIPKLKEYIEKMPKSNIYKKRLSLEVL